MRSKVVERRFHVKCSYHRSRQKMERKKLEEVGMADSLVVCTISQASAYVHAHQIMHLQGVEVFMCEPCMNKYAGRSSTTESV